MALRITGIAMRRVGVWCGGWIGVGAPVELEPELSAVLQGTAVNPPCEAPLNQSPRPRIKHRRPALPVQSLTGSHPRPITCCVAAGMPGPQASIPKTRLSFVTHLSEHRASGINIDIGGSHRPCDDIHPSCNPATPTTLINLHHSNIALLYVR